MVSEEAYQLYRRQQEPYWLVNVAEYEFENQVIISTPTMEPVVSAIWRIYGHPFISAIIAINFIVTTTSGIRSRFSKLVYDPTLALHLVANVHVLMDVPDVGDLTILVHISITINLVRWSHPGDLTHF